MTKKKDTEFFSKEDLLIWKKVTNSIKPLDQENKFDIEIVNKDVFEKKRTEKTDFFQIDQKQPQIKKSSSKPQQLSHGDSRGSDFRTAQKLKRGHYKIEGTIDLHGFSRDKAYEQLHKFLVLSYHQHKKCVLIITGKGSITNPGVIRTSISDWLNQPAFHHIVKAFSYARLKDGGRGAIYVLLKNK